MSSTLVKTTIPEVCGGFTPRRDFFLSPGGPARPSARTPFALGRFLSWILVLASLIVAAPGALAQAIFSTPQPVGSASGAQNVTVTAQAAGTVASVEVLTQGVAGLDFAKGAGILTCESATLSAGATCQESVTFTPAAPGLRIGAVVLLNSGGAALGTAFLSGTGLGGLGVLVPGNVLGVAGDGIYKGSVLDGNPATSASLYLPTGVTLDGAASTIGSGRSRRLPALSPP